MWIWEKLSLAVLTVEELLFVKYNKTLENGSEIYRSLYSTVLNITFAMVTTMATRISKSSRFNQQNDNLACTSYFWHVSLPSLHFYVTGQIWSQIKTILPMLILQFPLSVRTRRQTNLWINLQSWTKSVENFSLS